IVIHSAMILALCLAMKPSHHGSADAQRGSMGIVLHRTSMKDGGGERPVVQQAVAIMDVQAPPLLLASAPVATSEPEAAQPEPQPMNSTSDSTATKAKPQAKGAKPSGKGSGRPTASAGVHGGSGTNGYAEVSVFGVQGKGNKFIYVFDRS